jgi:glucans biosynthesis protein
VRRREIIKALSILPASAILAAVGLPLHGWLDRFWAVASAADTTPFSAATVQEQARALAAQEYVPVKSDLPKALQELDYSAYRDIQYKRERVIWLSEHLPFQMDMLHLGFIYKTPVEIYTVADGQAQRLTYSPDLYNFGRLVQPPAENSVQDFSGFRLRALLNRTDDYDEFAVFQGASYFRAVAKNQWYGMSARGLALKTASSDGEEFPFFRSFWIERPPVASSTIVVHALLDSPSTSGAYRFTMRPGNPTSMDVEITLYPRVELKQVGLAPLTSMYFFGPNDQGGVDDFRPAVHDSDGLAIWNGRDEWLWRPLTNPKTLQISAFVDANPRGFGLLQRHRQFAEYQDLEARYELRPSLWVEPIGDWGRGVVQLVEIPSNSEFNDNVVAFWQPDQALPAQAEFRFTYRLHWCWTPPAVPPMATAMETRIGAGREENSRHVVIDFIGGRLAELTYDHPVRAAVTTSAGALKEVVVYPNPVVGGWRLSFLLLPEGADSCELRATLHLGEELLSEVWSYRWTP